MTTAEKIVSVLLGEGKVSDWLYGKWQDVKSITGVGHDSFGLGKNTEKGWKPKYGPVAGQPYKQKYKVRRKLPPKEDAPWDLF